MAIGGIQGAQQAAALSWLRGVNAQTRNFGEGISQTLQASEQVAGSSGAQSNLSASGASSVPTPSNTTQVAPTASSDGSRGSQLDIMA